MSKEGPAEKPIDELPRGVKENLSSQEEVISFLKTFAVVERPNYIILTNLRLAYFDDKRLGRYDFISLPFQKILQMRANRGVFLWGDISFKAEDGHIVFLEKVDREDMLSFIETLRIAYNRIAVEPISIRHTKSLVGQESWEFDKPAEVVFRQQPIPQPQTSPTSSEDALSQLKMRFIKGEISEEEYRSKLRVLEEE
jgi:hypothetical protein